MTTKIYGESDDLVEFDGDVRGEFGCYDEPVLVACSDGTVLSVSYGKGARGIWTVSVIRPGELFEGVEVCDDEDAHPYSDIAHFRDGLKWAYAGKGCERVH